MNVLVVFSFLVVTVIAWPLPAVHLVPSDQHVESDDAEFSSTVYNSLEDGDTIPRNVFEQFLNWQVRESALMPGLPFETQTQNGFCSGKAVYFLGRPSENPGRYGFFINIQVGPKSPTNTIAFHFNPRFDEKIVVRNARLGADWGSEERSASYFPFKPGQLFMIKIKVTNSGFDVGVNGRYFVSFAHRFQHPCQLRYIRIDGEVEIWQILVA